MVKSGISWWWMKRLLSLVLFLLLILCQLWLLPKNIQWSSDSFAAASITSSWQSTITNVYNGSAFQRSSSCTRIKKIAEWNICWDPIDRAISSRSCLVYSFGIALDDPFTNFMASAGCKVFAFDPAQKYQRDYKPNVTFHQYGLVSGIHDENRAIVTWDGETPDQDSTKLSLKFKGNWGILTHKFRLSKLTAKVASGIYLQRLRTQHSPGLIRF